MPETRRQTDSGAVQPLSLQILDAPVSPAFDDRPVRCLELSSRGDRVPAQLVLPSTGAGPHPVAVLAHGLGMTWETTSRELVSRADPGLAWLGIDLPLNGVRRSPKLSDYLAESIRSGAPGANQRCLVEQLARQGDSDLGRCLDVAEELDDLDGGRTALVGVGLGAALCARCAARDARPRAVVLIDAGTDQVPGAIDVAPHLAAIAPRPLLLVGSNRDEASAAATQALADRAGSTAEALLLDAARGGLLEAAAEAVSDFLLDRLGRS